MKKLTNIYCGINSITAQKKKFPLTISSVNVAKSAEWPYLVTFTEEILNGKTHFCAVYCNI